MQIKRVTVSKEANVCYGSWLARRRYRQFRGPGLIMFRGIFIREGSLFFFYGVRVRLKIVKYFSSFFFSFPRGCLVSGLRRRNKIFVRNVFPLLELFDVLFLFFLPIFEIAIVGFGRFPFLFHRRGTRVTHSGELHASFLDNSFLRARLLQRNAIDTPMNINKNERTKEFYIRLSIFVAFLVRVLAMKAL